MSRVDRRTISLLGLAALLSSPRALAQDVYPSRPIRLIVGFTPGAASDIAGRVFAQGAGPLLGQQFVVENKPGAGSSIAAQYVARAANDGYTLFVPALSTLTNEIVNPAPSFDMSKDFAPIALLANLAIVLVVNPTTDVHSVAELVTLAKAKPGQVFYASVGAGSLPHLCAALFAQRAGLDLVHVPYPGSPQAITDVIAGRITMFFAPASGVVGQIASGKVTALATAADKRPSALPDVPTMAEAGMPDFDTSLWLGLLAPAGTPRPVIDKLADAARKAMHAPDAVETLRKQGYDPLDAGPDEFGAFIRSEVVRWSEVARTAGLKS
ncbi:MAG TPA: tripartite tricarboxylate transporter substrate binding protein [Xanthobacteraceae bacterium]|nr:tripartite tricarboxylate transporter substrate binding protein [Xanthobacteraceae bacterium]